MVGGVQGERATEAERRADALQVKLNKARDVHDQEVGDSRGPRSDGAGARTTIQAHRDN